jgi:hypothetical protein
MSRSPSLQALACGAALALFALGCQTAAPAARKGGAMLDPCAERLHEISGALLLYCSSTGQLPEKLADLKAADLEPLPPLVCPLSGKPYVYDPQGLPVQGRRGRLVVYDAAPSHNGKRWGILADLGADDKPLSSRVVLVPEGPVFSAGKKPETRPGG